VLVEEIKKYVQKVWSDPIKYWSLIIVTFIVSRVGTWLYPFDSDHWIFFYVGKNWFHGGSLYVTAWDHKPPVIFFLNGLMSLLSNDIVVHRILITGFTLLDIYLFYLLAKMLASKLITKPKIEETFVKLSLLLYVFWRNLLPFTSSGNNNENFGLVVYLGMLIGYFSFREDRKWWKLVLSGLFFSVLFFMKGNFLLLAAPVGIMLLVEYFRDLKKFLTYAFAFGLPLLLMAGTWVAYFSSKGSLNEFIFATFTFSAKYSTSAWKGDLSNLNIFYLLVAFAAPLIIMVPIYTFAKTWQKRSDHTYLFFALTFVFGSFAFFAVGVPYLYYFLILMPVYSLMGAYLLLNEAEYGKYTYYIFCSVFLFGMALNLTYSLYQTCKGQIGHVSKEAQEYRDIAAYIDSKTTPTDKVFAADYGATFYQLSNRDSGSRYISASVLLLDYRDKYNFGLDNKFEADMDKSEAKYVVVYRDRNSLYYKNVPMVKYFDSHYQIEKTFETFIVLRRK
jgi:4-amino-4-deoxy-L-arabinose transferase-like glycosyltransferase